MYVQYEMGKATLAIIVIFLLNMCQLYSTNVYRILLSFRPIMHHAISQYVYISFLLYKLKMRKNTIDKSGDCFNS